MDTSVADYTMVGGKKKKKKKKKKGKKKGANDTSVVSDKGQGLGVINEEVDKERQGEDQPSEVVKNPFSNT